MYYRPPKYTNDAPINNDESSTVPPSYTVRFYYGYFYDYLERCPCCGEPVLSGWNYCPFCGCDLRKR